MQLDKILIIDDDKSLGLSLKKILEKKGFIAEYVHSGKKAKEVLNQESFLVAILDIKLPDIDGIELLSELKEEYPFIEYIIITGYASINNVKLALNKEAFAFLEKPFEMSILESLVRSAIEKHRLKLELITSEKKYRGLFKNTPYSIVLVNMAGVIIDCNAALEKLMGNDKCEIINRNYLDSPIFPLDNLKLFNEKFKVLIKGKTADPIEIKFIEKKKKQLKWLKYNFSFIYLANETLIYILIQDITKIKQSEQEVIKLEQTLHEMNALIENAPVAIFLMHQNGKILRINEEAENLFNYREEDFLNMKIFDLFEADFLKIIKRHYNNDIYDLSLPNKIEVSVKTKEGKLVDVEITSAILKIADNLIIQSFFSDISERKDHERQREILLDQLLDSLEFKSKFLATMSHELRTPLNAILGFSQLLLEDSYGKTNEDQKEFLRDINSAGDHLLILINSILDISKIEVGKFEINIKEFNLNEILYEINSIIKPLYEKKGLNFNIEGINSTTYLNADQVRFKQVLYNLIDNAIKFTEKGSITFKAIERKDHWEFQVKDTGIGIAKKDYEVVFREFGRIENDKIKEVSGSGLGLALSKRIINLHGGDIWFESKLGKATVFYFTIPKIPISN